MGCSSCGVGSDGAPSGCGDKGHCTSGSCNKLNTYDWIATRDMFDPTEYNIVEVSFKKGAHKDFFINDPSNQTMTGDMVVVETASGYDVGRISLSGELVRLQMKKKYTTEERVAHKVIRKANERDLEKLEEARSLEKETMVKARVISRTMGLDMKIGDIEYQGDKKKATFYYTAEGRVDFRELVKEYAREFRVKIEMRQIGARQESARIGGIGSCGRELCCSTWLSDFKSVNTGAARYQNIAINQSKLSGQCGRLKCCLNYELDTYMDALEDFPDNVDFLKTKGGNARLLKTDIFKGLLYYVYDNEKMRGNIIAVDKARVKEIKDLNKKGIFPDELAPINIAANKPITADDVNYEPEYEDVTGLIELKNEPRKKKKSKPQQNKGNRPNGGTAPNQSNQQSNQPNQQRRQQQSNNQSSAEGSGQKSNTPNQPRPPRQNNPNNPNNKQNRPASDETKSGQPNQQRPPRNENQGNPNQRGPKPVHPNQKNQQPQVKKDTPPTNTNDGPTPNAKPEGTSGEQANKKKKFWNKNRKPKDSGQ